MCNIAIHANDTTLFSKCDQASDLLQQAELVSELESDFKTLWTVAGSGLSILVLEKLSYLSLFVLITLLLLM